MFPPRSWVFIEGDGVGRFLQDVALYVIDADVPQNRQAGGVLDAAGDGLVFVFLQLGVGGCLLYTSDAADDFAVV